MNIAFHFFCVLSSWDWMREKRRTEETAYSDTSEVVFTSAQPFKKPWCTLDFLKNRFNVLVVGK